MSATTSFDNDLAVKYGINEAILLNNFQYWVRLNKHNKSEQHFYHEKYWTYQTQEALHALFPYWALSTIQRTLKSMVEQGLIIAKQLKKSQHDRTTWYTLTDEMWQFFDGDNVAGSSMSKVDTRTRQNDVIHDVKMTDSEHVKMTCSYLNSHNQSQHTVIIPPNPQEGHGNVNATPVPNNPVQPNFEINISDNQRDLAWNAWKHLITENELQFTNLELNAIKAFALSKPNMREIAIRATLTMLYNWAENEGLNISDALTRSLSTKTIVQPLLRKELDSQNKRIYDIELLGRYRANQIKQEQAGAA